MAMWSCKKQAIMFCKILACVLAVSLYSVNGISEFSVTTTVSNPSSGDSWCRAFKISSLEARERHIVQIDPIISKEDEANVHHMALYACMDNFNELALDSNYQCFKKTTPKAFNGCAGRSLIFAWTKGVQNFKFPSHVGYPIGCKTCTKYALLETYFDGSINKNQVTTGFKMHHEISRKYSADVLTTGFRTSGSIVIPPKQTRWVSASYCTKKCTANIDHKSAINGNEIKLFAWMPHAHAGVKEVWVQHVGSQKEISQILKDDNHNANNESVRLLKNEVSFKAGDELITYCSYDTSNMADTLVGGQYVNQAMCLSSFIFYPRINLSSCISQDYRVLEKFSKKYAKPVKDIGFGIVFDRADPATAHPLQFVNWTGVKWNSAMVDELKKIHAYNGPDAIKEVCMKASSNSYVDYNTFKVSINQQQCPKGVSGFVSNPKPSEVLVTVFMLLCMIKIFMQ